MSRPLSSYAPSFLIDDFVVEALSLSEAVRVREESIWEGDHCEHEETSRLGSGN